MPPTGSSSGRAWEKIPSAPLPARGINHASWVWDRADTTQRAYFKWRSGDARSSLYSLGMERVAYTLAAQLGFPVKETYLDEVDGHLGVAVMRIPGRTWWDIEADFDAGVDVEILNRAEWPAFMAFDVLLANCDRHAENIHVEWDPPGQLRPSGGEHCTTWLLDFGFAGLWTPRKFNPLFTAADILSVAPDADLRDDTIDKFRASLPTKWRQSWMTADRDAVLDHITQISEHQLEQAVLEVPADYITPDEADLTVRFLISRLHRLDSLLARVFP